MSSGVTVFDVGVTTLTNVDAISNIALDIRDMASLLEQDDWVQARRIYEFGRNSKQYDVYGNEMDKLFSLQQMAYSEAGEDMFNEDPTYMFHILGLANVGESLDVTIGKHSNYANNYITELLNDYDSGTLGAQAQTILIVSMYATHMLWDGLHDCLAVRNGYNADMDKTGKINPKQKFDNFIALYIGAGQTLAPDWDGDMLYELAQAGGDLFGTITSEDEAIVNSDVKQLYQTIQRQMSQEGYCRRDDQIAFLWTLVNRIVAKMYVPMTQMLIHSMNQVDQAHKVRMYALALIPQLSQCRPSVHRKLKDYLLDKKYDRDDFDRIVELLQQSYDCLGFRCADVGSYKKGTVKGCSGGDVADDDYEDDDHNANLPMAAFMPKEHVRQLSKTDLDILAIEQLLKFSSKTKNSMAQLYYKYGRAAAMDDEDFGFESTSLQDMTQLSETGKWSPYYSDYITYFTKDRYADEAILATFEDSESDQRSAFIVSLIKFNVVPQFMMGLIGLALQICEDADNQVSPTKYWDAFAALYIGSLEGANPSGSDDDGVMLWGLAKNRARQFNTQNENFGAVVNDEMTDLLYAGQAELRRGDCVNFDKTASRVLHLMLVPLIQSTIYYAIRNNGKGASSGDEGLALGEAAAYSTLPIVSKYDEDAATVIERNMIRANGIAPVSEGPQSVANAYFDILDDIGWGCEYVGQAEGISACESYAPNALKNTASALFKPGAATIFVGVASVVWAIFSS